MQASLRAQTLKGVLWSFSELLLRKGVSGLATIILAWFLTPEEFGLVAMLAVFLALSNVLVDAGLSEALIRKDVVSNRDYDTAFIVNLVLAVLIYGVLYFLAPLIADFYQEEKLIALVRVAAIAVFFNAFSVTQKAALSRGLNFKLQMQVSLPSAIVSGAVAILLAHLSFGVWALVLQLLVQAMMTSLLYWRLDLARPKLNFHWRECKELISFSGYLLLAQIVNIPFKYMYLVVIAKLFSAQTAGLYFFADRIKTLLVEQFVASIQTVTYPALARVQKEPEQLKEGYRQIISIMTFLIFPVLLFLAASMQTIFHLFLPSEWSGAAHYLQIMCLISLMYPLNAININILKVVGRSDLLFYLGVFKKTLAVFIFVFSIKYGVVGVLLGQMLSTFLSYIPNSYFSKKLINYSILEQISDFLPALLTAGGVGLFIWLLQLSLSCDSFFELSAILLVSTTIYIAIAYLTKLRAFNLTRGLFRKKYKNFKVID
jgi:O-antigen/teichoic acid export membrane protein